MEDRLPFSEEKKEEYFLRDFDQSIDEDELKWHFDDENRIVIPVECDGWKLQIDESLPFEMIVGTSYFIPVDVYHRIIKGRGNLKLKVYKLDKNPSQIPLFKRTHSQDQELSDNLIFHANNNIPVHKNAFRYGSDAWCDLIQECKILYESGKIDLSKDEIQFLKDDPGKIIYINQKKVILNTPFRNSENKDFQYYVDVLDSNGEIKRIQFNED